MCAATVQFRVLICATVTVSQIDVVIPAYCEEKTIAEALQRLDDCLRRDGLIPRLIVVVDGPGDETAARARQTQLSNLTVIELDRNRGKGYAIRTGLKHVTSDYCAYIDGDLDLHPDSLVAGFSLLRTARSSVACVAGSKHHPSSVITYPISRRLMSHVYRRVVKWSLRLRVTDTQTGLKIFRTSAIEEILGVLTEDGFAIDLEILSLLLDYGYDIWEVPVVLDYSFTSTVSVRSATDAFLAVWRVRKKLRGRQRLTD